MEHPSEQHYSTSGGTETQLNIVMAGDVMLGRLVDQIFPTHVEDKQECHHAQNLLSRRPDKIKELKEQKYKYVWGNLLNEFINGDFRVINLETSVTTHPGKWPNKAFNYRMHPDNLQCLKEANIDYCSLANNHTLDFNVEGMVETMKSLTDRGIKWAGVGMNKHEAQSPAIVNCRGLKIACFSMSDHPSMWPATDTKPGINFINVEKHKQSDVDRIKQLVEQTKQQHEVDMVMMSLHWGSNYCWNPPASFQRFAHSLIDECGVDIIHGHSSHHIQGIEIYKEKPIVYGCGDFIDDYAVDEEYRNNLGFLYKLTMRVNPSAHACSVSRIELIPTKISQFQATTEMTDEERKWLGKTMGILSERLGTRTQTLPDGRVCILPTTQSQ